jgi:hypothetical protein
VIFSSLPALAAEWYEGGTLQKATIVEWQKATPENQLATAADFIASLSSISDLSALKDAQEVAKIKQRSVDLRECVNQSINNEENAPDRAIAELVLFCTIFKQKK